MARARRSLTLTPQRRTPDVKESLLTCHSDPTLTTHAAAWPPLRIWGIRLSAELQRNLIGQVSTRQSQTGQRWILASAPPADACIVGGPIAPSLLPITATIPFRVWLFDPAPDAGAAMSTVKLADRAPPRNVPQALACIDTLQTLRSATTGPFAPGSPVTVLPPEAMRDLVWHRFKLCRWPSASLMARHTWAYRLSPFLANTHLSLPHLVTLSGVPPSHCLAFLRDMLSHQCLRVDLYAERWPLSVQLPTLSAQVSHPVTGTVNRTVSADAAPETRTTTSRTRIPAERLGLLARLRQQLGLVHDQP